MRANYQKNERGPIDCSDDNLMVRVGLRQPMSNINYSVFQYTDSEKYKLKNIRIKKKKIINRVTWIILCCSKKVMSNCMMDFCDYFEYFLLSGHFFFSYSRKTKFYGIL